MYSPDYDLTNKTWTHRIKNAFPGFMNQKPESTNQKILNIIAKCANKYKNDLLYITDQCNINEASGQILTDLAHDYGVNRIDNDDEFLRFEVKFQMWKENLGPGRNDFNDVIHFILGVKPSEFNIVPTGLKEFKITNIPWNFDSGDKARLKRSMISSIIQYVAPPEFKIDYVEYSYVNKPQRYFADVTSHTKFIRVFPKPMHYFKRFFNNKFVGDQVTNEAFNTKKNRFEKPAHYFKKHSGELYSADYVSNNDADVKSNRFEKPVHYSKHHQERLFSGNHVSSNSKNTKESRIEKPLHAIKHHRNSKSSDNFVTKLSHGSKGIKHENPLHYQNHVKDAAKQHQFNYHLMHQHKQNHKKE